MARPRTYTPPQKPSTIEQTIAALDAARALLIDAGDPDIGLAPLDELGRRAIALKRAQFHVTSLLEQLELCIPEAMDEPAVTIAGFGTLVKAPRRSDRWKDPEAGDRMRAYLRRQIVAAVSTTTNDKTGEVRRSKVAERAAGEAVDAVYEAVGSFQKVLAPAQHRFELDLSWYRVVDEVAGVDLLPEGGRW